MADAVAAALAANLFLQPNVVRWLMDYFLGTHTPLDELADGIRRSRLDELESDTRLLVGALLQRPVDFEVRAQVGVVGRDPAAQPRVQAIFHWLGSAFAVPDTVLIDARFTELVTVLATMTAAPDCYWTNVVRGGMVGHVVAQGFRFTTVLRMAYSPPFMVAVMVDAQLDAIAARMDAQLLLVHGPLMLNALGKALASQSSARFTAPPPPPNEMAVVTHLATLLKNGSDFSNVRASVKLLVANLSALALYGYASVRAMADDTQSVASGDAQTLLARAARGEVV